jgi:sortase (surface protein transpeptidase)
VIRFLGILAATLAVGGLVFTPSAASVAAAPVAKPVTPFPVAIDVPSINALSNLIPLKKMSNGELEVPSVDRPMLAGWFAEGVRPGDDGPAVIAGHVNGRISGIAVPGIFSKLKQMIPGDKIHILRSDDSEVSFAVTAVREYKKAEFPTEMVYGNTTGSELRLITCGGAYDSATHNYEDNIIVYAVRI